MTAPRETGTQDQARPLDHGEILLIGADYSVYSRICRFALRLKGVPHRFEFLDVFASGGADRARQAGNPFGKIPILRHDGLTLFETRAITRYVDDRFDGPALEPDDPADRARMNQIVSIVDNEVYPAIVWGLHVPKSNGREPATDMTARGIAALDALEALARKPWLCGPTPTLADAYLAACMDYVIDSAAGSHLAATCPVLFDWWSIVKDRPQFA